MSSSCWGFLAVLTKFRHQKPADMQRKPRSWLLGGRTSSSVHKSHTHDPRRPALMSMPIFGTSMSSSCWGVLAVLTQFRHQKPAAMQRKPRSWLLGGRTSSSVHESHTHDPRRPALMSMPIFGTSMNNVSSCWGFLAVLTKFRLQPIEIGQRWRFILKY
jgi:hypothetical protein